MPLMTMNEGWRAPAYIGLEVFATLLLLALGRNIYSYLLSLSIITIANTTHLQFPKHDLEYKYLYWPPLYKKGQLYHHHKHF